MISQWLSVCKDEIAIEGSFGIVEQYLWKRAEERVGFSLSDHFRDKLRHLLTTAQGIRRDGQSYFAELNFRRHILNLNHHVGVFDNESSTALIEEITRSRYDGFWGFEATNLLGLDPRQLHSVINPLESFGIIKRFTLTVPISVQIAKNSSSNVSQFLILSRFFDLNRLSDDVAHLVRKELNLPDPLVELFFESLVRKIHQRGHLVSESVARDTALSVLNSDWQKTVHSTRNFFRHAKDSLVESKRIALINVPGTTESEIAFTLPEYIRQFRESTDLVLSDGALSSNPHDDSQRTLAMNIDSLRNASRKTSVLKSLNIFIRCSGSGGTAAVTISDSLEIPRKLMERFTEILLDDDSVVRVSDVGRAFRWISKIYHQNVVSNNFSVANSSVFNRRLAHILDFFEGTSAMSALEISNKLVSLEVSNGWTTAGMTIDRRTILRLIHSTRGKLLVANRGDFVRGAQPFHVVYNPNLVSPEMACETIYPSTEGQAQTTKSTDVTNLDSNIEATAGSLLKQRRCDRKPETGKEVMLHFGYVKYCMTRMKILHKFLIGLALSRRKAYGGELQTFYVSEILQNMPLIVFLQTLGHSEFSNELEEFMLSEVASTSILVKDLPVSLREKLLNTPSKGITIEYDIRSSLSPLVKLRLLEISAIDKAYIVNDSYNMDSFFAAVSHNSRQYQFWDQDACDEFWTDYYRECQLCFTRPKNSLPSSFPGILPETLNEAAWKTAVILSQLQRKSLNNFSVSIEQKQVARDREGLLFVDLSNTELKEVCFNCGINTLVALEYLKRRAKLLQSDTSVVYLDRRSQFFCHICGWQTGQIPSLSAHYWNTHERNLPDDEFIFSALKHRNVSEQKLTRRNRFADGEPGELSHDVFKSFAANFGYSNSQDMTEFIEALEGPTTCSSTKSSSEITRSRVFKGSSLLDESDFKPATEAANDSVISLLSTISMFSEPEESTKISNLFECKGIEDKERTEFAEYWFTQGKILKPSPRSFILELSRSYKQSFYGNPYVLELLKRLANKREFSSRESLMLWEPDDTVLTYLCIEKIIYGTITTNISWEGVPDFEIIRQTDDSLNGVAIHLQSSKSLCFSQTRLDLDVDGNQPEKFQSFLDVFLMGDVVSRKDVFARSPIPMFSQNEDEVDVFSSLLFRSGILCLEAPTSVLHALRVINNVISKQGPKGIQLIELKTLLETLVRDPMEIIRLFEALRLSIRISAGYQSRLISSEFAEPWMISRQPGGSDFDFCSEATPIYFQVHFSPQSLLNADIFKEIASLIAHERIIPFSKVPLALWVTPNGATNIRLVFNILSSLTSYMLIKPGITVRQIMENNKSINSSETLILIELLNQEKLTRFEVDNMVFLNETSFW